MTGLVLAGGGVKGSYQVGAYLAFKKCGIRIDGIVGTSIGAFNGAMIVSGKVKELYEFWQNVNVGELLNFDSKYVKSVNKNEIFKRLIYGIEEMSSIIKNKGIDNKQIKEVLNNMLDEKKIRKSKMDYGLVTVRVDDFKPLYLFKEDMQEGKMADYILASCNLPIFKSAKLIDNNYYVDGGFYDNNPINMLLNKGYDKIYSVEIQGIGLVQKIKNNKNVIKISPSKFLGSLLNVNQSKIRENIKLGYYDTLKVLKDYDGYNFIFKKHRDVLYNRLAKKANKELYIKCKKYFHTFSDKELVLKCLEYVMTKEKLTYFEVYKVLRQIRFIKKNATQKNFVYEFIRSM